MGKSYGEIFHEMVTMPNVQWPEVWQAILETLCCFDAFCICLWTYIRGITLFICEK